MSTSLSKLPYHLRLAMLSQNIRINRARRHAGFGRYGSTKACRIKVSAAANDMLLGQARELERKVRQDVNRIRNQKQDGGFLQRLHVTDHAAQDVAVAVDEIRTRFAYKSQSSEPFWRQISMER